MIKNKFKFVLAASLAVASAQVAALNVRLDRPVSVKSSPTSQYSVAQAFPDVNNCRAWYYLAAQQEVSGPFLHRAGETVIRPDGVSHLALISTMDFLAKPEITQETLALLKAQIAELSKSNEKCAGENLTADNIVLLPALVRVVDVENRNAKKNFIYKEVRPTYLPQENEYSDATNPISLTYITDVSAAASKSQLEKLRKQSELGPQQIGVVHFVLDGIAQEINAKLSVVGKLNATFASEIKNTKCEVTDKSKGLSADGAAMGVAAGGMAGGGTASVGFTDKTTRCNYDLITSFENGKYGVQATTDYSGFNFKTADDQPIQIISCNDKNDCAKVDLESYVRQELWGMWFRNNFDVQIKSISDKTYEVTLGRAGEVAVEINASTVFRRSFYGELAIQVPVVARNLSADSFDFSRFDDALGKCAQENYSFQLTEFFSLEGVSPIPLAKECLRPSPSPSPTPVAGKN